MTCSDGTTVADEAVNLATLRDRAENAPRDERAAAWERYHARCRAECARRDKLRALNAAAARGLGERLGRLRGVVVESAEADDFARAEFCLIIDGKRFWTRPTHLDDKAYGRLRDAISARRRGDDRARNWLSHLEIPRAYVRWDGIERLRFDRNQYGYEQWR